MLSVGPNCLLQFTFYYLCRAAPERVAFCANFSRLLNFQVDVNLQFQCSFRFRSAFSRFAFWARILLPASLHSAQMSKPSIRRRRRGALGSCKLLPCSDLGLESSWPIGLASWIKRLDCASSYPSTSSSRRCQPARPMMPRREAILLPLQITLTHCRRSSLLRPLHCGPPPNCDLVRVARLRPAHKPHTCGNPVQDLCSNLYPCCVPLLSLPTLPRLPSSPLCPLLSPVPSVISLFVPP